MNLKKTVLGALMLALFCLLAVGCNQGGEVAPDFPEKDIEFVLTAPPGGGIDTYTRAMVPFLEKHLPNKVNIVVKNMPGGEHAIGIGRMVDAKPDGHTLCTFNLPGWAMSEAYGRWDFKFGEFTWLGNIISVPTVLLVNTDSPYDSLDDIVAAGEDKVLKVPSMVYTSVIGTASIALTNEMGVEAELIQSQSVGEIVAALLRGEGDFILSVPAAVKGQVESNKLKPLAVLGNERYADWPEVPTIEELGYSSDLVLFGESYYFVGTTPGVPEETASILQDAFKKAINDPEFAEVLAEMDEKPNYMSSEECLKKIEDSIALYKKYEPVLGEYINK